MMLKNELSLISELVSELTVNKGHIQLDCIDSREFVARTEQYCVAIQQAFTEAIFSNARNCTLRRYFGFHLKGISEMSDTLQIFEGKCVNQQLLKAFNNKLLSLIHFVQHNCSRYVDQDLYAPRYWRERVIKDISQKTRTFLTALSTAPIDAMLKDSVVAYLVETSEIGPKRFSYGTLHYYEKFINTLSEIYLGCPEAGRVLSDKLSAINFNHLQFLVYRQNQIRNKAGSFVTPKLSLEFLRTERDNMDYLHQENAPCCFVRWPSLKIMLSKWVSEEIVLAEKKALQEVYINPIHGCNKIWLDLPTAHIACLIRLFQEENVFGTTSLSEVFRFVARNYSSKRQSVISVGGLSKEYYSINQITAARVQDMLKKMVQRINHNFFPLLVVTSLIAVALKETRLIPEASDKKTPVYSPVPRDWYL